MSAQHIGQHSPALRTKPQDQQGQSCFLFNPNSNLLSFDQGESSFKKVDLFACPKDPSHLLIVSWIYIHFFHSTMTASLFSNLGFIHCLNVLLLLLTDGSSSSPIRSPENNHGAPVFRDARDNPLLDAQDFLSQFLSTLNLTEMRPQPRPLAARKESPEYMLELYNRFANDRTAIPSASIVRSFKNEGTNLFLF